MKSKGSILDKVLIKGSERIREVGQNCFVLRNNLFVNLINQVTCTKQAIVLRSGRTAGNIHHASS